MRRFSLRDLFWLTLVVGLALGWWLDHGRMNEQFNRLQNEIAKVEGKVIVNGVPLAAGKIIFIAPDGGIFGCTIKGGTFNIMRAPVGKWSVIVEGTGVSEKYGSLDSSFLKAAVRPGQNVLDFHLIE